MASPLGHALVGVGCAATAALATGTLASPQLWMGAAVAGTLPDADWIPVCLGVAGRRAHRHGSHSLLVAVALIALVSGIIALLPGNPDWGLVISLAVALISHSLLDLITTSPYAAARGFGIPLIWPLSSRRWTLQPPVFPTAEPKEYLSFRGAWRALLIEISLLGPVALGLVLLSSRS